MRNIVLIFAAFLALSSTATAQTPHCVIEGKIEGTPPEVITLTFRSYSNVSPVQAVEIPVIDNKFDISIIAPNTQLATLWWGSEHSKPNLPCTMLIQEKDTISLIVYEYMDSTEVVRGVENMRFRELISQAHSLFNAADINRAIEMLDQNDMLFTERAKEISRLMDEATTPDERYKLYLEREQIEVYTPQYKRLLKEQQLIIDRHDHWIIDQASNDSTGSAASLAHLYLIILRRVSSDYDLGNSVTNSAINVFLEHYDQKFYGTLLHYSIADWIEGCIGHKLRVAEIKRDMKSK